MKTENINGFIWAVLDKEEAVNLWEQDYEVFLHYDDDTEALIEAYEDFDNIDTYVFAATKIGAKEDLEVDYLETVERNKENRSFEDWCLSKIE